MLVAKDTFLIRVDSAAVSELNVIGLDGKPIKIDTDYNKYSHAMRTGFVHACPMLISDKYFRDVKLNEGDCVLFHHFVCQPDHKIADNIYRAEYFHLYGKIVDGVLYPIEDMIFVTPEKESDEELFCGQFKLKSTADYVRQRGVVYAASPAAQARGILPGDTVYYTKDADYKFYIGDDLLYRMRIRNILAIERDGELKSVSGKLLFDKLPEEQGAISQLASRSQQKAEVIASGCEGVFSGDKFAYYNGVGGNFQYKGKAIYFIELRNINYLIKDMAPIPIYDRILIKQDAAEEMAGNFIIPDTAKEKPKKGTVISVGPNTVQCKEGDKVVYSEHGGAYVNVGEDELVIFRESELYLIL